MFFSIFGHFQENMMADKANPMGKMFEKGETVEFAGKAIVALAADKDVIKKTGRLGTRSPLLDTHQSWLQDCADC